MTDTVETNEELVAKARELCEELLKSTWEPSPLSRVLRTHLAEMEEHNKRTVDYRGNDYSCEVCGGLTNPCRGLVTKVKRLLGVG